MIRNLINFIVFQGAWFACILAAPRGLWYLPPIAAFVAAAVHLFATDVKVRAREAQFLLLVTLIGTIVDAVLVECDVITHASASRPVTYLWFAALWLSFATTLHASLNWLQNRTLIAALFGLIGGPLAYIAGEKLDAVTLPRGSVSLVVLAIEWAILTPLLTRKRGAHQ